MANFNLHCYEYHLSLGNIVELVGRVNRAFNTSMEVGVTVQIDNLVDKIHVCKVFFTFVEVNI